MKDSYSDYDYYDYSDSNEEESIPNYAAANYWDHRYAKVVDNYDWYMDWLIFKPTLDPYISGKESLLVFGCGNSTLSADISIDYFSQITSIDISQVVIEQMEKQYIDNPKLIWKTMDCRKMSFDSNTFDVVIDKGTIDALCCGANSDNDISSTAEEVYRVLKVGGFFIEITFGTPSHRLVYLNGQKFNWKVHTPILVGKNYPHNERSSFIYIYIFEKY